MTLFSSIVLGVIQGVTEFLPVSSSGHLAIAEQLFGMDGVSEIPAFFDVLLHLGTLAAVFVAYWDDIRAMVLELFRGIGDLSRRTVPHPLPSARRLILLILVGTLPLFLVLPVKDAVEALGDNLYFVAGALIFTGCLLFLCDHVAKGGKTERDASFRDVLTVGIAQAIATCPGISRSGATITAGCLAGFERTFAVRYSFLMSIPAILGANLLSLKDALEYGIVAEEIPLYLIGVVVAAVVGYACIRLLHMIARRGKFGGFAVYCWAVGALTLVGTLVKNLGGV
ncbi:MAG: undecaprenyl-diphosphate phosphatase [Oscillibacter sp.]|nr:undecaprenyl-diphosphate phosphatase [Oscillibacter sp.]